MNRALAIVLVLAGCDKVYNLTRPPDAPVDVPVDTPITPGTCNFDDAGPAYSVESKATTMVAGNFDQDNDVDIAVGTSASSQLLIHDNDNGSFGSTMIIDVDSPVIALAAADINSDGFDDIAFINSTTANAMLQTATSWDPRSVGLVGGLPRSLTFANFDGVGLIDMVVTIPSAEIVQLVLGDDLGYRRGTAIPTNATPVSAVAADIDDDADPDVIAAFEDIDAVGVYRDTGANFESSPPIQAGTKPNTVLVGKLGDRTVFDILVLNEATNDITVLRNDGNGAFTPGTVLAVGQGPRAMVLADIDADGFADIIVANNKMNSFSVLHGTATGFELHQDRTTVSKPIALAVADFTGDGHLDLAVLGEDTGFVIHTTICTPP